MDTGFRRTYAQLSGRYRCSQRCVRLLHVGSKHHGRHSPTNLSSASLRDPSGLPNHQLRSNHAGTLTHTAGFRLDTPKPHGMCRIMLCYTATHHSHTTPSRHPPVGDYTGGEPRSIAPERISSLRTHTPRVGTRQGEGAPRNPSTAAAPATIEHQESRGWVAIPPPAAPRDRPGRALSETSFSKICLRGAQPTCRGDGDHAASLPRFNSSRNQEGVASAR